MSPTAIRCLDRSILPALVLVVALGTAAHAFDGTSFSVAGSDDDLADRLRAASVLLNAEKTEQTNAQDLFADARAEYAALLGGLYEAGHYSPVIHVLVDGREAADIPPLDAPSVIGDIRVTVDPGPRFAFGQARIAPLPPGTKLPKGFALGQPAESGVLREATASGIDAWRGLGRAKARVSAQDIVADHGTAQLFADVALDPGPRLRFGRLEITGQDRMRERRIRKIAGLPEGEVFDPAQLARAQTRLRRTGVFKSVSLTEDERITSPDLLGITATVVEQKPRHYSLGAEIMSLDGLTLSAGWLHRNLMGGGERLEIKAEVLNLGAQTSGTDILLGVKLDRPATLTPDTTLSFEAEFGRLQEADFSADVFAFSTQLTHVFSDQLTGRAGLSYGYAGITDNIGTFTYRYLALPIGVTWDKRDSKVDASKGFYLDAEVKPYVGFGITDGAVRAKLDFRAYKALGDKERLVLAARFQAGSIFGGDLLDTPRDDLFYSGGGGTVRGQPYQSLGINVARAGGETTRIGGSQFLAGSLEARVKVSDKIGIVGFVDAGRVDVGGFFNDAGDWHAGAGVGVRYATGVGPIRFDIAGPVGGDTGSGLQIYVGLGQAF